MVEINKENKDQAPAASCAAPLANCGQQPGDGGKHTPTVGERLFDGGVYTGIGYFLNLGISILIADKFLRGNWRPALDKISNWTSKHLVRFTSLSSKKAGEYSFTAFKTMALLSGGTLLMIPIRMLENRKREIVHWLDKKLGCTQKAPDGRELTADEIVLHKEPPDQSWLNMGWRRLLSIFAVLAGSEILDRTVTHKAVEDFGVKATTNAMNLVGAKNLAQNDRFRRYTRLTVLDAIFTGISSMTIYLTNGTHSLFKKKPKANVVTTNEKITDNTKTTAPSATEKKYTATIAPRESASHAATVAASRADDAAPTLSPV